MVRFPMSISEAERINEYLYRDDVMDEFVDLVREARRIKE